MNWRSCMFKWRTPVTRQRAWLNRIFSQQVINSFPESHATKPRSGDELSQELPMTARRVLLLSRERFYGGFASCFVPWPWEFLKHVLNSSLDCTLIWIAEYVLGDFVFSMAGRSVYGMLYTFIEHSVYKCDRLDWTRPPRASMLKKRVTLSYLYYSTNHVLLDDVN